MNDITIIIPVRSGSVRCPRKNSRRFFNTNLLVHKLSVVKKIKNVSKIIVSSSDPELLEIARQNKVDIHIREPVYSQTTTTGSELFKCLADAVSTTHFLYVTCVSPFVQLETYQKAIDTYFEHLQSNKFDSLVCCKKVQEFLWFNQQPLNYDPTTAPPSQFLPDIYALTFGFNILPTQYVKDFQSIVGKKPYMFEVNEIEGIDIDTQFDFTIAELLFSNSLSTDLDIATHNTLTNNTGDVSILDCTIRDGGYLNDWNYSYETVLQMYKAVSLSGIQYFELGFICNIDKQSRNVGQWWNISDKTFSDLRQQIPNGCKLAAMIHLEHIVRLDKKIKDLDMVRVLINPIKTNVRAVDFYKKLLTNLVSLDYIVTVNIAYADILTDTQLNDVLNLIPSGVGYVYIADTFGSITSNRLKAIIRHVKKRVPHVRLGFHGHNNTQSSISNSKDAIDNGVSIIDVTIGGQGRGGGNTPSELFLQHLNSYSYDVLPILHFLESYQNLTRSQQLVILHTVTGLHKIHPDQADFALESCSSLSNAYQYILDSI
jgi:4-hydroxy 2-oxovalerate aldolase